MSDQNVIATPARAGRKEWLGLAVIALPCALYAMDLTVLNLALPTISRELAPSGAGLLWIVDIYGFMVAGLLMTMGTLGDRYGRRRVLLIGAAAFGAASVLAAYSTSAEMLIAARALLGIAGATVAPSTLALIRQMFHDAAERRFAIGVWVVGYSAGGAIGPVVGGALLESFWWGSVFLLAVPVMALLLIVGPVLLPKHCDERGSAPLDPASVVLSITAVLATVYGIKQIAEHGPALLPLATVAAGAVLGLLFVRRQHALADPMIDPRLFATPAFRAALGAYALGTFAAFGLFIFISQYLQLVLGLSSLVAGLWTLPFSAGFVLGALTAPRLAERFGAPRTMTAGMWLATLGFAICATQAGARGPALLVAGFALYALGLAPVFTLATDLVVGAAPAERAGAASALSETGSELGGALGIALLGSIGTAAYRLAWPDAAPPGVPGDAYETARSTLGGALTAAQHLGGAPGTALAETARTAFAHAMRSAAITATVAMAAMAWLGARPLRAAEP